MACRAVFVRSLYRHMEMMADYRYMYGHPKSDRNYTRATKVFVRFMLKSDALPAMKDDTLRLYSMLYCPYAQRPRLVLEHKGVTYETVNVNLKDKPSWLWERNPNGTVPILETNDKVLYESGVIMEYIDEAYPGRRLTPTDPYTKAKGRILVEEFNNVLVLYYKALRVAEEERKPAVQAFHAQMEIFHNYMPNTKFLTGDEVGIHDYYCWPWAERFPNMKALTGYEGIPAYRFQKFHAWIPAMEETPGVKATRISLDHHLTFTRKYFQPGPVDYDFALKK